MTEHDESLFQRINRARATHVGALRVALNGAGLREKGGAQTNLTASAQQIRTRLMDLQYAQAADGYDIERVIQAATALRAALAPFDASIPRCTQEPTP